jgi:uncharacterized lipoprotein YmbA
MNKTALIWEINDPIYQNSYLVYDNRWLTICSSTFVKPSRKKQVLITSTEAAEKLKIKRILRIELVTVAQFLNMVQ